MGQYDPVHRWLGSHKKKSTLQKGLGFFLKNISNIKIEQYDLIHNLWFNIGQLKKKKSVKYYYLSICVPISHEKKNK